LDNCRDAGARNVSIDHFMHGDQRILRISDDGCSMDFNGLHKALSVGHTTPAPNRIGKARRPNLCAQLYSLP